VNSDLSVDADQMRGWATHLEQTARALAEGTAGAPGLTVTAPAWATATALRDLESAVSAALGLAAARVARSGRLVRQAAAGYDDADGRAVARLSRVG
jgi:hypothetical protein